MSQQQVGQLRPACDVQCAAWVLAALRDFDYTVGSEIPPLFEAYARVFHPAWRSTGENEIAVRWAEIAQANDRTMHSAAEWGSITGSWEYQYRSTQPGLWDRAPSTGELPREVAQRLAAILAEHTDDPSVSFFAVWEGWGTLGPTFCFPQGTPNEARQHAREAFDGGVAAWRGLLESAASLELSNRPMRLLQGPLGAIEDFYERYDGPSSLCLRSPPSLWWPVDRSWCVSTDIDLMTTYVGGSARAVEALLADDRIEALPVLDDQRVTWDADTINPLPAPP
jgi:hypothetical protein